MTAALPGTVVGRMTEHDLQENNEYRFSKKHIDTYLHTYIRETPDCEERVQAGIKLLKEWLSDTSEMFHLKQTRLAELDILQLEELVREILVGICYCQIPQLFVSVTSQLACRIGFEDHTDSIRTTAEIVSVLAHADCFDIQKEDAESSLMVVSTMPLPDALIEAIDRSMFIPPMVCLPQELTSNFESPHLTFKENLILGSQNMHLGNICLDVINLQNQIPLSLHTGFLSTVEEENTHALDTNRKMDNWANFKYQSYCVYAMLVEQGNKFYLDNKVDKRGRLYANGYHVTTQGSPFKKASIELHHKELTTGVPT